MWLWPTVCKEGIYNCFMWYLTQKILPSSYCPVNPLGNYLAFKTKGNNLRGTGTSIYNLEINGTKLYAAQITNPGITKWSELVCVMLAHGFQKPSLKDPYCGACDSVFTNSVPVFANKISVVSSACEPYLFREMWDSSDSEPVPGQMACIYQIPTFFFHILVLASGITISQLPRVEMILDWPLLFGSHIQSLFESTSLPL